MTSYVKTSYVMTSNIMTSYAVPPIKIRTKNVQNQTKIGPNGTSSRAIQPKSDQNPDLMGLIFGPLQHKSGQNSDFLS